MKRKGLAVLFAISLVVNLILAIGFTGHGNVVEASVSIQAGDIVEFGSYPQSQVTDETLLATLQSKVSGKTFKTYPYTSANPDFHQISGTFFFFFFKVPCGQNHGIPSGLEFGRSEFKRTARMEWFSEG